MSGRNGIYWPANGELWFPVSVPENRRAALAVMIPRDRNSLTRQEHADLMEMKVARLVREAGSEARYLIEEAVSGLESEWDEMGTPELTSALMMSDRMSRLFGMIEWEKEIRRPTTDESLTVEQDYREVDLAALVEMI